MDPLTHHLVRATDGNMINPADLNALEAALLIKDAAASSGDACTVTTLSMGPPDAEESLYETMAIGADEACLLTDRAFAGSDTIATTRVLAAGIRHLGQWDLILTGAESADGATGQIGPMLAEALAVPHVTNVREIEGDAESGLIVRKKFQRAEIRLHAACPAVLSLGYGCNEPRLPTLRSKIAAKKKPLRVLTNAELLLQQDGIGAMGSPTEVEDVFLAEGAGCCTWLTGSAADVAGQMLTLIKKEMENR
jgi:electron transfer flavoprotein beta subunit